MAEAEKTSRKRKEAAEETLRRAELNFKGDLGLSADRVAAFALHKVEEIDTFKAQLDQHFKEGRTSVLGAANQVVQTIPTVEPAVIDPTA